MLEDYNIQPFSLDLYPLMRKLFLSAFETELSYEAFIKKYDTKNLGHPVVGFLAIDKLTKEPAAYYGVFPLTLLIRGEKKLAAQSGDTMTHKNHRKKGLFVQLAKITFEECRARGFVMIFGQPNAFSKHGLINSLKFLHLDDVNRYDLKLKIKTLPLFKISRRLGFLKAYNNYAKTVLRKHIIQQVDDFTNPANELPIKTLRDKNYLLYKEADDKFFIKINSVVLWIKLAEILWIGDADNYDKIDAPVIRKLKRLAFALGINTISFHINNAMMRPAFLNSFSAYSTEASCFYYLDNDYDNSNMIITGADFDTW